MNKALKSALIELKNDGVALDPIVDLDHILALHNLSLEMLSPRDAPGESFLFQPVCQIGNVTLRRLSLGAKRFLADVVFHWFPDDVRWQDLSYAYCMAVGDDPALLWVFQSNRRSFQKAVQAWEKTVGVSFEALKDAIRSFQDGPQRESEGVSIRPGDYRAALGILDDWRPLPKPYKLECEAALIAKSAEVAQTRSDYGPVIDMLLREYPGTGKTGEDWIWRTPDAEIESILHTRRERLDAEARAMKQTTDSRFMRAHRAFCEYKDLVRRIKKGET
jgi:hypothetical protein